MLLPAAVSAVVLGGRLAAAASSGPVLPIDVKGPPPKYPIGAVKEPFAKVSGHLFEVNGTVGYFAGTNAWWLGHLSNNDDVDTVLKQFNDVGYTVVRVWGFGDVSVEPSEAAAASQTDPNRVWYQVINSTGTFVNYGETGLERLDYAVSAAERAGVKLVLPFVNYWDDYGGIQIYNKAFGGNKRTWYTDARSQKAYRAWIKVLVERYRESPAIFCWQLANEPRCEGCDDDYNTILRWVNETSAYIKSLDPHHMVTTGEEGFFDRSDKVNNGFGIYSGIAGSSFPRNTAIPTIDYGVFHLYVSLRP